MLYEIRTYTLKPGTVPEFEKRFEAVLPIRLKYSELAAFWHTASGPLNEVIHVWPYEDLNQRADVQSRCAQERDWPPNVADFVVFQKSEIFVPAPFSPKLGGGQKLGNIYEMRIYQYQPRSIPTVIERWGEALKGGRLKLSPIAACMSSNIGQLNVWIHIWPYPSLNDRERVVAEALKLGTWPPKTREFLVSQQSKFMIPASFSPMA